MSDSVPTPPAYEPAPVPAPAPAYSSAPPVGAKTNTLAIVALILGIVVPIGGIITGHIALGQIKRTGEAGHGLALAGTIIGYVGSAGWIIFWVVYILAIVLAVSTGGYTGY